MAHGSVDVCRPLRRRRVRRTSPRAALSEVRIPGRDARNLLLFGGTAENGRKVRGIAGHRGKAAADKLKGDVLRLYNLRKSRAADA